MVGSQGLYRVTNVAKTRIWNPAQWKLMSEEAKWASPDFLGERKLGERSERSTKGVGARGGARRRGKKAHEEEEEEEDADVEENAAVDMDMKMEDPSPPAEPIESRMDDDLPAVPVASTSAPPTVPYPLRHLSPNKQAATPSASVSSSGSPPAVSKSTPALPKKRPTNLQRAEPSLQEWQTFMATFEELPHGMKVEDYTIELLREVERRYWRTLTFGEAPMYGADMKGKFFVLFLCRTLSLSMLTLTLVL